MCSPGPEVNGVLAQFQRSLGLAKIQDNGRHIGVFAVT
jgi:hypothetical protein